jgi:uncharacterized protein (TIGR03084 family)
MCDSTFSVDWLARQHADLDAMLLDRPVSDFARPSRCPGWNVCDVVLHLAQSDELAVASIEGRLGEAFGNGTVDEWAEGAVAHERGDAYAIFERWRRTAGKLREVVADADPSTRVQWVAGHLSVRTLSTTRLSEAWIHTGDIAVAFDTEPAADERLQLIARLAWRTMPYAFARAGRELTGPVAFDLIAPSGEQWAFGLDEQPVTIVRGPALELCLVAGQRANASDTSLSAEGPDADAALALVRTFA